MSDIERERFIQAVHRMKAALAGLGISPRGLEISLPEKDHSQLEYFMRDMPRSDAVDLHTPAGTLAVLGVPIRGRKQ